MAVHAQAPDERRKHRRFSVKENSSFVMTHDWPSLGKVVNLSQGGLSFEYFAKERWPEKDIYQGMLFGDNESCLNSIPLLIVHDYVVSDGHIDKMTALRRCCVEFGEMTGKQRFLLECFMWVNCTTEC